MKPFSELSEPCPARMNEQILPDSWIKCCCVTDAECDKKFCPYRKRRKKTGIISKTQAYWEGINEVKE